MNDKRLLRTAAILIAGCLLITALLSACSGGSKEDAEKDAPKQEEEKEQKEPEETKDEEEPEEDKKEKKMAEITTDNITINTQSSIKIEGSKIIYLDPYKRSEAAHDADMILITHSHYDHLDPASIKNVAKDGTVVVCPLSIKGEVEAAMQDSGAKYSLAGMEAGSVYTPKEIAGSIKISAVPAYNIGKSFHKKEYGWLGYVLEMDGVRYFDAGDTDVIDEHDDVKCDIAFIPVGGTYTMTAKEAAGLVNRMKPKYVIPIHYGSIVGSSKDAETLKAGIKDSGIKVVSKVEDAN